MIGYYLNIRYDKSLSNGINHVASDIFKWYQCLQFIIKLFVSHVIA
jgi:hypothetical protein